ncbi:MAG: CARDB domain-containing protein [Candidatus Aenigmatarchaeota archaeon]
MRWKLILLLLLLSISFVYALEVYVRPPRMIARINLTQTNSWHGFIEVKNNNNETVNVSFTPIGNITDKIRISKKIELKPGELRQENFTLIVDKPGIYEGGVVVTYTKEGEIPVALQSEIIIIASGEKKSSNPPYYFLLLPLILLAILMFMRTKKGKILMLLLMFLPLTQAANIALIVKNSTDLDYVHEYRIHRILKDMHHDVMLIDNSNYKNYDFNSFSAIIIAGRPSNVYASEHLDSFVASLPVNSKPTLVIDSVYPDDFGWVHPGAIGSVFSSNPTYITIVDNSTMLHGYQLNARVRAHIINNQPVLNVELFRSPLSVAASLTSSSNYAVIAYAEPGTLLLNNNITSARIVFFGIAEPIYWTDDVELMFKNSVNWLLNNEYILPTQPFIGDYNLLPINVYGDNSRQFLVDLGKDGIYEKYWDPSRGMITNVFMKEYGVYAIDIDADGNYDYIYDRGFLIGLPDLTIESINFLDEPTEGGKLNVRITAKNIGSGIARNFNLVVLFDSTLLESKNIPSLDANQQYVVNLEIQNLPKGHHEIKAIVDQQNSVFERNENNNQLSKSYVISYELAYEYSRGRVGEGTTTTLIFREQGDINITLPSKVELLQGEKVSIEIKFYNPLDYPIYDIYPLVDSEGFDVRWYAFEPKEIDVLQPKQEKIMRMQIHIPENAKIYTYKIFFRFPSKSEYGTRTYAKTMYLQVKESITTTPVSTTTTLQEKREITGLTVATFFKWTAIALALIFLAILLWFYYPRLKKSGYIVGKGWRHSRFKNI